MIQYMIPGLWRAMHETISRYLKKKNEKGNEEREREETSMKKFKKLLAGLLAGAMMLGSMSVTAFAAEETNTPKTTAATIDTSLKGSLTIHKYYFTNSQPGTLKEGTGEAGEEIPSGATPLEGAEFSIWRVADIDGTIEGKTDQKFEVVGDASDVTNARTLVRGKTADARQTTDKDGVVVFGKNNETGANTLELGYYYVKETKTPANISSTPAEFVVSVPMTDKKPDGGTKWIYDVTVYPKNVKTEAGVTINKVNAAGDPIDANAQFVLQKKDGTTWKYVKDTSLNETTKSYDYNVANFDEATQFTQGVSITGLGNGSYRLFEVSADNGYIMDGTIAYEFTIADNGNITSAGKYLTYTSSEGEDVENQKSAIITVKNEKPDMTKQVQKRDNTWGQDADYNVGDMVPYKITVDVPSNITSLKEFTLTDTPTNLEDDIDSVAVKDGETSLTKDTNYTISKDTTNEKGFKISFKTTTMAAYAGKQLVITYNAKLLDSAVTSTDPNTNSAKLEYSNKILPDTDDGSNPNKPGEPGKDSIEDNAIVYTFSVKIDKRANSATGDPLSGVIFDLYKYAGTESNPTEAELKANGTRIANGLKTGTDGTITKSGLANGTYYLVETKTVKGYNLLKAPVRVELSIAYTTTTKTEHYTTKNGVKTLVKHEVETTTSTVTHTETIINKNGFTLPTTGGMGTIAITALGVALAFAGVLIIGASRKKTVK